jgi:hypothetical protein
VDATAAVLAVVGLAVVGTEEEVALVLPPPLHAATPTAMTATGANSRRCDKGISPTYGRLGSTMPAPRFTPGKTSLATAAATIPARRILV